MHFDSKKVIVVGGSAGMGRQVAVDIVRHGGSAVIVGRSKERVDDTVDRTDRRGWPSLGDHCRVDRSRRGRRCSACAF